MSEKTADRRVRRTKKHLRQALTKLLLEKELKDISVLELTELADINRGTFYLHYRDIYDLYEKTEGEILDKFNNIIKRHVQQKRKGIPLPAVADALDFLEQNADICRAILKTNDTAFLSKLIEMNKPKDLNQWKQLFGDEKEGLYEFYYSYITSGCVGLIRSWFMNGMKEPTKKLAELAEHMMMNTIRS